MGLIYFRLNNPNLEILEHRLWNGAEKVASFASGMAAISTMLLALLQPGNVVLHSEPVYGGSDFFLKNVLRRFGIEAVSFRPTDTPAQLAARAAAIAPVRLASKSVMRNIKAIRTFMGTKCDPTQLRLDVCA